jgi:amidase
MPTASGAPELKEHRPAANAVAVQRLIDDGAIVFGKTNLPRFAMDWQSFNEVYGTTNNPWDLERSPGGSSGGAAAALAAGLTPLELGSDISGSIRIPAHYCGVYGHKPTLGIVPTTGHIPGPPGTLSEGDLTVVGPLARSPDDLELALDVIAGPNRLGRRAWHLNLAPPRAKVLQDYRVAYWFEDKFCPLDATVLTRLQETVRTLRDAGVDAVVMPSEAFNLEEIADLYVQLFGAVFGLGLPSSAFTVLRILKPALRAIGRLGLPPGKVFPKLIRGATQTHRDWVWANEAREHLRYHCAAFFHDFDVLLAPVAPTTALPHMQDGSIATRTITVQGQKRPYTDHMPWIALATVAGLPATVAPIGLAGDGLPVGIQIIGPYLEDRTTIDFARRLGDIVGGFIPPPGMA